MKRFVLLILLFLYLPFMGTAKELPYERGIEVVEGSHDTRLNNLIPFSIVTFRGYWRYPAEERRWLQMVDALAYFRDVLGGGATLITGARDGETWTADAELPDGSMLRWPTIRFYRSYGGNSDCFVSPYWTICGTTSLEVLWWTTVQCQPTGLWRMNFYNNDNYLFSAEFNLLPQIERGRVPLYNQLAYTDHYDNLCRTTTCSGRVCDGPCGTRANEIPVTIAQEGCALTDAVMVLNYHGVRTDPPTLNRWLVENYGYDEMGRLRWGRIPVYATEQGVAMSFLGTRGDLERSICAYGPQIISVRDRVHWVTPYGRDVNRTTYLINDPNGGRDTTLAERYSNTYRDIRLFGGPEYSYTDRSGINIRFHSPGELLIIDPQGRRTGYDPVTKTFYEEIPMSGYDTYGQDDDVTGEIGELDTKELDIRQPLPGDYQLLVTGTETGTYILEIDVYGPDGMPYYKKPPTFKDISITPNEIHTYAFYYPKTAGDKLEFKAVVGNFDGRGQRPSDVNKFLSYVAPKQGITRLEAGTTAYSMVIIYDKNIIPATFRAELNGRNISNIFHPREGWIESVKIPLNQGRNTLMLSVEGRLDGRIANDTDRLVFIVP